MSGPGEDWAGAGMRQQQWVLLLITFIIIRPETVLKCVILFKTVLARGNAL